VVPGFDVVVVDQVADWANEPPAVRRSIGAVRTRVLATNRTTPRRAAFVVAAKPRENEVSRPCSRRPGI
jgi:hypothetical protein